MPWSILVLTPVEEWLYSLDESDYDAIAAAVDLLQDKGPGLGRPAVDTITRSTYKNMKELRSFGGHLRVLFIFDPQRQAILLIGGDKRQQWNRWYQNAILIAEQRYTEYLQTLNTSKEHSS